MLGLYVAGWTFLGLLIGAVVFVVAWNLRNDYNKNRPIRIKMAGDSPDLLIESGTVTREGTKDSWLLEGLFNEARVDSSRVDGEPDSSD
jgi:hypothetical protein